MGTPLMTGRQPAWERFYARGMIVTDTLVVFLTVAVAQLIRYGTDAAELGIALADQVSFSLQYTSVSLLICLGWLAALTFLETRDPKRLTTGPTEYIRVINATLFTFGFVAIVGFVTKAQIGRGYLLVALPLGVILLLASRVLWRRWIEQGRMKNDYTYRTLIVGDRAKTAHVAKELLGPESNGFQLVGAITEQGRHQEIQPGLPVLGGYSSLLHHIDALNIETVIVTSADALTPPELQQIGWELEARQIDLIVAAALTDIAGPRVHVRPISGLPLIHVDYPVFTGRRYLAKRLFDIVATSLGIIVLSPVLLVIALLVRSDGGPALFRQERIGINGKRFGMLKFRSMVPNAEELLAGLVHSSEGNDVLFKMKDDPRVTKVGRFLRRYSLDELPQLFNVLRGEMSLVGPRPPLGREVEMYEEHVMRRFLVKPGITGLWQVSGRSDLSWEDSVRLDLYYVENWSLSGDLVILARTVRAVVAPEGAY